MSRTSKLKSSSLPDLTESQGSKLIENSSQELNQDIYKKWDELNINYKELSEKIAQIEQDSEQLKQDSEQLKQKSDSLEQRYITIMGIFMGLFVALNSATHLVDLIKGLKFLPALGVVVATITLILVTIWFLIRQIKQLQSPNTKHNTHPHLLWIVLLCIVFIISLVCLAMIIYHLHTAGYLDQMRYTVL
jgi:hypothetical protein